MRFPAIFLLLAVHAGISSALKISVTQQKRSNLQRRAGGAGFQVLPTIAAADDNSMGLNTAHDLIYMANVSIGGNAYQVQLDTGSSDLWLKGPSSPLPNVNQTTTTYNLTYGIGWAFGHISYGQVEFAGISVQSQAFLDVQSAQNPALGYGALGILGLGFTSLSTIDALVNNTGSAAGRSLLYNLFATNPSEPNFISFALQRSTEADDEVVGSFSIGEYEPAYGAVKDQVAIPTWPVNSPKRWNVLLDAVLIGGTTVTPTTAIPNVPSNKAVVLLDSGTSYTYAPEAICTAIYGGISGAKYDPTLGQWVVPCGTEIDMALQFNGHVYPMHPLDVTPAGLTDNSTCVGSFVPQAVAVGAGEFDWLVGDNFLRSVYSVYDFGDFDSNNNMGDPYVKLLSLIDPNEASADFVNVRGGTAKTNITYNASNDSNADPASTSVTLSTDVAKTLAQIGRYFPAMLGVMALNALVLIALVVLGIVLICRKRKRSGRVTRTPVGRMSPMPMNSRNSYVSGATSPQPHAYDPVSMAITEDTMFVPPSPGFRKFDGTDRPKSLASLPSHSRLYQQIGSEEHLSGVPSPAFAKDSRPMSVGMLPSQSSGYNPDQGDNQTEDQPFIAPTIALHHPEASDSRSFVGEGKTMDIADGPMHHSPPEDEPFAPPSPTKSFNSQRSLGQQPSDHGESPKPATPTTHSRTPSPPQMPATPPQMLSSPPQMPSTPPQTQMPSTPPSAPTLRPILKTRLDDRTRSAMIPSSHQVSPGPGSPTGLRPLRLSERPMSAMLPSQAQMYPQGPGAPFTPNSAPPLRPILNTRSSSDRPRSTAIPERGQTYPPPPSREIPFPPPSPTSRQLEGGLQQGGNISPVDRPRSVAVPSPSDMYQAAGQEDAVFSPPAPAFRRGGSPLRQGSGNAMPTDRPMSVGMLPSQASMFSPAQGNFAPPNPAFRSQGGMPRRPSNASLEPPSGDGRPMSMA